MSKEVIDSDSEHSIQDISNSRICSPNKEIDSVIQAETISEECLNFKNKENAIISDKQNDSCIGEIDPNHEDIEVNSRLVVGNSSIEEDGNDKIVSFEVIDSSNDEEEEILEKTCHTDFRIDKENLDKKIKQVNLEDKTHSGCEVERNFSLDQEHRQKNSRSYYSSAQKNSFNRAFMDSDANKENEGDGKSNKRRSDEGLEYRDELDFEEEKESGEEGEDSEDGNDEEGKVINKEEGELSDEDEDEASMRQEPKAVCRFFVKGQCTWGTNCRFLHPGVSDKGNYNMFAAPKAVADPDEKEESNLEKERPREVRPFIPEPPGFESAWERGLRHAKEMMKRASKRRETDADFEEKRFNLSLGQAELDRENDYYTRPASPAYKPSDEVIEYSDPFEKQAIRHFRGGHFENFEVRYKVGTDYPNRGPEHIRSRRDKFEQREVTERVPRRFRPAPVTVEEPKVVKEKRYPRPRNYKEDRAQEAAPTTVSKGGAEVWADPWARRKTPVKRVNKNQPPRARSYSSGSSSRSSRSSRSSSYSSYSRSGSRSSSRSWSSHSSSRSITPPIHPRQQRATMNRGARGGRGRGFDRGGGRGMGRGFSNQNPPFSQPPNPPPSHPLAPDVNYPRQPMGVNRGGIARDNRFQNARNQDQRNAQYNQSARPPMQLKQEPRKFPQETTFRERMPIQLKQEPTGRKMPQDVRERLTNPSKPDIRNAPTEQRERPILQRKPEPKQPFVNPQERPPIQRAVDPKNKQVEARERVDMFGRTIRKDPPKSPTPKSASRSPVRTKGRRKFSRSSSRSRSGSSSGSSRSRSDSRSRSGSRSRSRSDSRSRSRSSSSSNSSASPPPSPVNKRKAERGRRLGPPAVVSYGESAKSKAIDLVKVAGQKQQIKLTLKKPGPTKQPDKTVVAVDDDSGESDTDARILKKRKVEAAPPNPPPSKKPRAPSPTALASLTTGSSMNAKKPSAARREELLKQLRAVEDAIARKRTKPLA